MNSAAKQERIANLNKKLNRAWTTREEGWRERVKELEETLRTEVGGW